MQLAHAIGLRTASVAIGKVEGIDYLLVERYDRALRPDLPQGSQRIKREHQEDFCQALGIIPEHKYQNEGGPSLKQCFDLVRAISATPIIDLQLLLDAVIFNWLIGNNDAHGKNFSLVYRGELNAGLQTHLAPLYDLISTAYYPELSPKMAMKIGGEYLSESISQKNFDVLAGETGLAKPMLKRRISELAEAILSTLPTLIMDHPVAADVGTLIRRRCESKLRKFTL